MKIAFDKLSIKTFIWLFCLALGLTSLTASKILAANPDACCGADEDLVASKRLESARALTAEANNLLAINDVLLRWSWCVANLTKEVPHTDAEVGGVSTTRTEERDEPNAQFNTESKNFQQLLAAYQEARRAYLQHKMLYDRHVAAFHNQPQMVQSIQPTNTNQSSSATRTTPALWTPPYIPLRITIEDACAQLQMAEGMLRNTEMQMAQMITYLEEAKNKLPSEVYFERWSALQTMGTSLQREVLEYGRECIVKQKSTDAHMQNVEQEAAVGGNERQSRQVLVEVQRCSNLNNQETQGAHMHTMFVSNALYLIGKMSPLNQTVARTPPPGTVTSGATPTTEYVSSNEIEKESGALQVEYEVMQQKYKAAESANPALRNTKSSVHD